MLQFVHYAMICTLKPIGISKDMSSKSIVMIERRFQHLGGKRKLVGVDTPVVAVPDELNELIDYSLLVQNFARDDSEDNGLPTMVSIDNLVHENSDEIDFKAVSLEDHIADGSNDQTIDQEYQVRISLL